MSNMRIRIAAASLLFATILGCKPQADGPIAVQTTAVKYLSQDGDLYIGGAPTPEGLGDLKARGVTTIIDLRQANEATFDEEAAAQARGLRYIHLPMKSDQLTEEQAGRFIDALRPHNREKVLIHCAGGNRAAAMYGLYLGATRDCPTQEAMARAQRAGLTNEHLAEQVRSELEKRRKPLK